MFISALKNPNFVVFWANCLVSCFCLFLCIMSNEECVSNAYILCKWYGIFQPIFVSVYVAMQNWKIFSDKKYHKTPVYYRCPWANEANEYMPILHFKSNAHMKLKCFILEFVMILIKYIPGISSNGFCF